MSSNSKSRGPYFEKYNKEKSKVTSFRLGDLTEYISNVAIQQDTSKSKVVIQHLEKAKKVFEFEESCNATDIFVVIQQLQQLKPKIKMIFELFGKAVEIQDFLDLVNNDDIEAITEIEKVLNDESS